MTGLGRISALLRNVFAIGRLSVVDDSGVQQVGQLHVAAGGPDGVEEIIDKLTRLGDYGIAYCPPDGSEAIAIFLGGRRSGGVVIATGHRASRPKDLKPGEVQIYNGVTGDFVRMCQDGKIRSKGDWIHDGTFHAVGSLTSEAEVIDHSDGTSGVTVKTLRDDYNAHKHTDPQGGTTGPTDHLAT